MTSISAALVCDIDLDAVDAAVQSVTAVDAIACSASEAGDPVAQAYRDRFMLLHDLGNLFLCEAVEKPAGGATILHRIEVKPSDRYCELVAAIAAHGDAYGVLVVHGWPILFNKSGDDRPCAAAPDDASETSATQEQAA